MRIVNEQQSFKGNIIYANLGARELGQKSREGINILKHHCGNKNFEHVITAGHDFISINTIFVRNKKKSDGIDRYVLTTCRLKDGINNPEEFNDMTKFHYIRHKKWKKRIDNIKEEEETKKSFWAQCIDFFKNLLA